MKNKFKQRLKELREEKGLSIEGLAKAVNVSAACISRWENGLRIPNIDSIILLCEFFKVSADYLIGLTDY